MGSSVAEFDRQLETYFIETQPFRQLVRAQKDIVAGDKGTGKTALFRVLHKRYLTIRELSNIIVLPAFNPTGDPIFQPLAKSAVLEEAEYIQLWKAFLLSLVGNWILKHNKYRPKSALFKLDQLLRGLDLRSDTDAPPHIFSQIMTKIGKFFRWNAAEFEIGLGSDGLTFKPRVEFDKTSEDSPDVSIVAALRLLNDALDELGKTVWVSMDRLDEAFQGFPEVEIPALRALFRTYLDLLEFDKVRLKLFVRKDLFARIIEGGFVNLTHVNAMKADVVWDEEDLLSLLCKRVKQNQDVFGKNGFDIRGTDKELFYKIFPQKVDQGSRKPETWVWILGRIRDGNGVTPPRNLIDLISFAREAQLRKEDREPREYDPARPLIEADALRKALLELSKQRVNDTLLAEARDLAPVIEGFRKGKAEYNKDMIAKVLGSGPKLELQIRKLTDLGFLEVAGGNYKIPMLYRGGLEITQGRA